MHIWFRKERSLVLHDKCYQACGSVVKTILFYMDYFADRREKQLAI